MGTDKRVRQKQGREAARQAALDAARKQRQRRVVRRVAILAAVSVVLIALIAVLRGGGDDDNRADQVDEDAAEVVRPAVVAPPEPGESLTEAAECPPTDGTATRVTAFSDEGIPDCIDPAVDYTATVVTNFGDIVIDLDAGGATEEVNVFVTLARYGYYDETAVFGTDPGAGTITGGAPQTNAPAGPGPGFRFSTDQDTAAEVGSLVLEPNASFRIVAAESRVESRGGTMIGTLDAGSLPVARTILGLHVARPGSIFGGPSEPVIVESVTITES